MRKFLLTVLVLMAIAPWLVAVCIYREKESLRRFLRYETKERKVLEETVRVASERAAEYERKYRKLNDRHNNAFGSVGWKVWDIAFFPTNQYGCLESAFDNEAQRDVAIAVFRNRMTEALGREWERIAGCEGVSNCWRWADGRGYRYDVYYPDANPLTLHIDVLDPANRPPEPTTLRIHAIR